MTEHASRQKADRTPTEGLPRLLDSVKISLPVDVGRATAQAASSRKASASAAQRVEAFIMMDVE